MRLLVVTDNRLVAEAIRRSLMHAPKMAVGYVDGRMSCGPEVAEFAPDAVIVDEMTQPGRAQARIRDIRAASPEAKVIVLSAGMDDAWLTDAVAAGAQAAISKSLSPASFGTLIREICLGSVFNAFAAGAPQSHAVVGHAGLTRREQEILRLVTQGKSNAGIAKELWVTEQTVKFHLSNVYRKLGVANRTQAGHYVHVHGLFEPAIPSVGEQADVPRLAA